MGRRHLLACSNENGGPQEEGLQWDEEWMDK